ncbi:apolipoprotein D [Cherax quadricarinatus]
MEAVMLLLVLVCVSASTVSAHDWELGSCSKVDPVPNFNTDNLLGQWYVIEQFDTTSTCLTLNYTRVSATQLKVTKSRQLVLLDSLSIEHTNSYTGTLDIPDVNNAGKMLAKWLLNIIGEIDYVVFDTDGETYAAIYDCQPVTTLGHRQSAAILSRTPSLPAATIVEIKQKLQNFNVNTNNFDKINQRDCIRRGDSGLNIDIDEDTFKNLISGASESFQTIATQVRNVARTVANVTKQLGSL